MQVAVDAAELTAHLQAVVNAAPTAGEGKRVHALVSALAGAGITGGYLANARLKQVHWQANGRAVKPPFREWPLFALRASGERRHAGTQGPRGGSGRWPEAWTRFPAGWGGAAQGTETPARYWPAEQSCQCPLDMAGGILRWSRHQQVTRHHSAHTMPFFCAIYEPAAAGPRPGGKRRSARYCG